MRARGRGSGNVNESLECRKRTWVQRSRGSSGLRLFLLLLAAAVAAAPSVWAAATVRVAVCQIQVTDGDVAGNLAKAESYVQQAAAAGAEICVFPELIDVGFGSIVTAPTGGEKARPIPGETSDALGAMAVQYNVWITAALLEEVPGGAYDTSVLIDSRGKVVLKVRKAFVYPAFGGSPAFQGNYQDAQLVESPGDR